MAFLFDSDALSEALRKRPLPAYLLWLSRIPRSQQFSSAVVIGELYKGAFRSTRPEWHLENIETRVLPGVTVLPFDTGVARVYGEIEAHLSQRGQRIEDSDLRIAATAIFHGLQLVTGNLRHFERIPGIQIHRALADARLA
ncbi:MAG TPA: VapC toxin family PIN domain ribonuclease [Acidobacteria bacterium]|nr:VapC toxin family PIN domain ribonuclease [Acidobacteriota bacterium]